LRHTPAVNPANFPQEQRQRRKDIAQLPRNGDIREDATVPMGFTLCFLADKIAWDRSSQWLQHADTLYKNMQEWGAGNPRMAQTDRDAFDRHLRRFLMATSLSFDIDPATKRISHLYQLRFTSRRRHPHERAAMIGHFAELDRA
jgi:hypothetical protein